MMKHDPDPLPNLNEDAAAGKKMVPAAQKWVRSRICWLLIPRLRNLKNVLTIDNPRRP